ncbi:YgaP-like transmembrane domain [Stutzerimonas azotifigens]|uniref:YgaP-like transmembrane domain n=1 Tax=Stutzerimonas azotifigens TaxID=291995 RepID=UPI000408F60A|nr:YgaP-like transmembrane domain [Stutzerimonas azotifigens]
MNPFFPDKSVPQNVHGFERAASIAGGLVLLGKGLRRGGLGGMLQLAMGGMVLARGVTGRCEAKRVLTDLDEHASMAEHKSSYMPLDASESDRDRLRANATAATETATVTGDDSLRSPSAGV